MIKLFILLVAIGTGALLGWKAGSPLGLMGAYFSAVIGASLGLFIGRRIQQNISDD